MLSELHTRAKNFGVWILDAQQYWNTETLVLLMLKLPELDTNPQPTTTQVRQVKMDLGPSQDRPNIIRSEILSLQCSRGPRLGTGLPSISRQLMNSQVAKKISDLTSLLSTSSYVAREGFSTFLAEHEVSKALESKDKLHTARCPVPKLAPTSHEKCQGQSTGDTKGLLYSELPRKT